LDVQKLFLRSFKPGFFLQKLVDEWRTITAMAKKVSPTSDDVYDGLQDGLAS
jgi:hypothetical protein